MKYAIEEFYDARFGMFIHWGLYSLLAGEWQGQRMDDIGEWIMSYHKIPIDEYEKLAARFNPTKFDADAIVRMARNAGMRYLVITSKHHEGFALFKSDADPYNVVDATPFGRDIIAELSQACRRHGMKFGVYYSQALDWHERNAGGWDDPAYLPARRPWANIWDFPDNTGKDFEEYFSRKVLPQVTELLTRYGDIFLIWFGGRYPPSSRSACTGMSSPPAPLPCQFAHRQRHGRLPEPATTSPSCAHASTESPVTLNDTWGYNITITTGRTAGHHRQADPAGRKGVISCSTSARAARLHPEETKRILAGRRVDGRVQRSAGKPAVIRPVRVPVGLGHLKGQPSVFLHERRENAAGAKTALRRSDR